MNINADIYRILNFMDTTLYTLSFINWKKVKVYKPLNFLLLFFLEQTNCDIKKEQACNCIHLISWLVECILTVLIRHIFWINILTVNNATCQIIYITKRNHCMKRKLNKKHMDDDTRCSKMQCLRPHVQQAGSIYGCDSLTAPHTLPICRYYMQSGNNKLTTFLALCKRICSKIRIVAAHTANISLVTSYIDLLALRDHIDG